MCFPARSAAKEQILRAAWHPWRPIFGGWFGNSPPGAAGARAVASPVAGRGSAPGSRPTGPRPLACVRAGRSSRRWPPRRARRGARCGCRTRRNGRARPGAAEGRASPRQTSLRPGAWWCRGCACQPNWSPTDRDTPEPLAGSRSAVPSAASSVRDRHSIRLSPFDLDLAPGTARPPRRSARGSRGRED